MNERGGAQVASLCPGETSTGRAAS